MHTFTIFDYAAYEITIFVFALLLAKILPFLTWMSTRVYVAIVAIGMTHLYERIYGTSHPTVEKTDTTVKKSSKKSVKKTAKK